MTQPATDFRAEAVSDTSRATGSNGACSVHGNRDLAIEYRSVANPIPYARNARTHTDGQVAEIAASIREFGWTNPILIDETNGIMAGHGRLLSARKLGMTEVPVIELARLSDTQRRALVIADNELALNAGWDTELLGLELGELGALGFDLVLTGFSLDEITELTSLGNPGLTDPDDVSPVSDKPVSRVSDLWILGRHRLNCGDSTSLADVERVLAGVKPHLMVTDPPYGVAYDPVCRAKLADHAGADLARGKVLNDDRADERGMCLVPR